MTESPSFTKRYFAKKAFVNQHWQHNVAIEVKDGVISEINTGQEPSGAELLTGPVLPAIANLHSHAFQYLMAGMAEVNLNPNDSFWSWRDLMYRIVGKLNPDDIEVIATQLYIDMLKGGYTQVGEFQYLFNDFDGGSYANKCEVSEKLVSAANTANIGITLLPTLYSHSGFGGQAPTEGQNRFINTTESYLENFTTMATKLEEHSLHSIGHCFHSLRAVTQGQMSEVLATVEGAIPVHIHIAEQQKEIQDSIAWSGKRPVEWLFDNFEVDRNWCLVHATHLSEYEIAIVAKSHAVVGLCPTTEANLGDGIFPGAEFTKAGGRWGIGSDSHVSLSVKDELRSLEYSQRLKDMQRNRLYGEDNPNIGEYIFNQAQQGGNQALNIDTGLTVGQRADFIVLDDSHPMIGARADRDIINSWVFASNENIVKDVFVAGEQAVSNFKHDLQDQSRTQFTKLMRRLA